MQASWLLRIAGISALAPLEVRASLVRAFDDMGLFVGPMVGYSIDRRRRLGTLVIGAVGRAAGENAAVMEWRMRRSLVDFALGGGVEGMAPLEVQRHLGLLKRTLQAFGLCSAGILAFSGHPWKWCITFVLSTVRAGSIAFMQVHHGRRTLRNRRCLLSFEL